MTTATAISRGLSSAEAAARLRQHGPNVLPQAPPVPLWRRVVAQFRSPLIYILLFALAVDLAIWFFEGHTQWPVESLAIAVILMLNAGLGVYQETKAEVALAHLKTMAESTVWVARSGRIERLPSTQLVPGDVVRIGAGERVPADGYLIEAYGIMIDESIVTGESLPVDRVTGDEVLSATLVTRGKAYMEVSRTGAVSSAGNLAVMIKSIEADQTPLERRLGAFGTQLARWISVLTAVIVIAGVFVEGFHRLGHVFIFAVALAVAVVPEGLPAVLTLTLALGVERMARKKAVVRKLSAVEALGSVTVIATDKTGTLTENEMRVKDIDSVDTEHALRAMALANDCEHGVAAGDPLELALLNYAVEQGVDVAAVVRQSPRHSLLSFDSSHKFMRVTVEEEGHLASYLKGAPEVLLERSELQANERQNWHEKAEVYATEGFRVIALARRAGEGDDDLNFLGLVLLWDPPRAEVPAAIRQARDAGIRVVMVTGDHPATALAVANEVGIPPGRVMTGVDLGTLSPAELTHAVQTANVFARVTPQDKLRLVDALKHRGEIVAVTGDGVNDAPALKRSDVGVAMGERGSDVSREVSDLVLLDDNFATIVAAIREGRNIYENIQKFIRFLFCANFALTLIVVFGALGSLVLDLRDASGGLLLPLTAMQLLWINVITNGPPALALGLDRNHDLMEQPPRDPRAPVLDRVALRFILIAGSFSALVGGLMLIMLARYGFALEVSRTMLFLYASISQLLLAYSSRRIITMPRMNVVLHLAVGLCLTIQVLTVLLPALRNLLGLERLNLTAGSWVAAAIIISYVAAETYSRITLWSIHGSREWLRLRNLPLLRRVSIAVVGVTVLIIGLALLVLPGPGLLVIALGLAILATEFVWARALLSKARAAVSRRAKQNNRVS